MSDKSPRATLNHLIETCKDGEHGFRHAADLVTDDALKSLFGDIADQRSRIADELTPHAQRLGGAATSDGTAGAAVHRRWMDLRSTMSGHDDGTVLAEARRGDAVTVMVFKSALQGVLPATVRDLVERKFNELRQSHDYLDELERTRLVGM